MAILQISKIQQRSGNLVDLPQLDDAEFGWANDAKRLFIGKTTPNENVEILTSYSQISFSQIDGAVGNLNISNVSIENGQVLAYDGTNWVNKGGTAGGLLTLGDVGNVKITGGAVGYVLETDGTGNLSWTPKGTLAANILNVSKADPAVVTTVNENFFENGSQVTITNPQGMDELAGNIYYANVLTSTTFELYTSFDGANFSGNVDSTSYTDYSYTTVSATTVSTDVITVGDATVFSEAQAVRFIGNLSTSGLENNVTYYVANAVSTSLKVANSPDGNLLANVVTLQTTSGLTAEVYAIEGQAVATIGSTVSFPVAGGSDTQVQYNESGALNGNSAFTYDYGNSILTLNGNANVSNLNATGVATATRFLSNVANGTPPLQVTSYTRVSNLSVAYANVSDFGVVTNQTTGTFYPVFVSSSASGNRALGANANISFNAATGNLSTTLLNVTSNANIGNVGTTTLIATTGNIGTINSGLLQNGNSNVTITANGNITVTSTSNATLVVTGTGVNVTGTLNATGNANVGNLGTAGLITATGNITGGNLITGGVVAATGNVSGGNLTTAGALSVTGNANIGNVGTTTVIATTGNITTINGGLLQNGNSNVTITNNANITLTAKSNATLVISDTGANIAGTGNISGNANVGNLGTGGLIVATGNITGGNLVTGGALSVTGNANIGNIGAAAGVFTANVTAGNVYANSGTIGASLLTGTLTTAAQPNVTSLGTLSSLTVSGNANLSGNINFTGAKANLGSNANLTLTGGTSGQLLATDGSGNLSWVSQGSIIGGAAGSNTQIQYNALGLLAASANFTFNYATNALTVTGNISGANLTTAGAVAATGNVSGANLVATGYHIRSITTGITAAGSTQGAATALTKEINVVSTVSSGANGVVLPTAVAGMVLIINNRSANTLNVYPASGGAINSGSANAAYSHSSNASIQYYATSSTQWYTVGATFA